MAKKLLCAIVLMLALVCVLASCGHEHNYGEWETTKATSCTAEGAKERYCSCGEKQTESISATGHSFGEWQIEHRATCLATGTDVQYCARCNYKNTRTTYGDHELNSQNICSTCNRQFINMTESEKSIANAVHYISERKVEYDKNNDWFKFTFALKDKDEYKLNVPTFVDIRIENDNAVVVYEKTILISASDYKNNLATVYIKSSDIKTDYVDDGDFYYKVYNPDYFSFAEYSLSVSDLPIIATTLVIPRLPQTCHYYNVLQHTAFNVTSIRYEMNGNSMKIYFSGEKKYDVNGSSYSCRCAARYTVYDSEGYAVSSGVFLSDSICVGDKFKDEYVLVPNLEIGETYTLVLSDYST